MTYYKENGGKKDISQMEQNREVVVVKWSVLLTIFANNMSSNSAEQILM